MMSSISLYLLILLLLLIAVMVISVRTGKLTLPAAFAASAIGLVVFQSAQLKGILILMTFFLISILATSHKKTVKAKLHPDNLANKGRNTGQVLANGGVAGLTAILAILNPSHHHLYLLMMAASLASALADTLSSELGMVYGRRFYNIITFKRDTNGLDGVISIEGLLIGAAGAGIIALIYSGFSYVSLIIVCAGIFGNLTDSILGATLERKHFIGNNIVNFLNTLFAALVAMIIYLLF